MTTITTETLVSGITSVSDDANLEQHLTTSMQEGQALCDSVEKAPRSYFAHLEGQPVTDVYNTVLYEVGVSLLETTMNHAKGGRTEASELLGLNCGTLRKRLKQCDLLQEWRRTPVKGTHPGRYPRSETSPQDPCNGRPNHPPAHPSRIDQRLRQDRRRQLRL